MCGTFSRFLWKHETVPSIWFGWASDQITFWKIYSYSSHPMTLLSLEIIFCTHAQLATSNRPTEAKTTTAISISVRSSCFIISALHNCKCTSGFFLLSKLFKHLQCWAFLTKTHLEEEVALGLVTAHIERIQQRVTFPWTEWKKIYSKLPLCVAIRQIFTVIASLKPKEVESIRRQVSTANSTLQPEERVLLIDELIGRCYCTKRLYILERL